MEMEGKSVGQKDPCERSFLPREAKVVAMEGKGRNGRKARRKNRAHRAIEERGAFSEQ